LEYISKINAIYQTGQATEHSYRPALQAYLEALLPDITATNEPKRQKCGAPDYIVTKNGIDIGYIEAKDIGMDLAKIASEPQLLRYRESLDNLILTDYLQFHFFKDSVKVAEIAIAEVKNGKITALSDNIPILENLLHAFAASESQTITDSKNLAVLLARKAKLMREVFTKALSNEEEKGGLTLQLQAFRQILIHDMPLEDFADVYAQTITYGMFTARLHSDETQPFSRTQSLQLIPNSNPFLRKLFQYVALELEEGVKWIVDALCEVLRFTNIHDIMQDFGRQSGRDDPVIHFYETFLAEYSPDTRKSRGVWYTPEPIVNFIIRAVDEALKTCFDLPLGIADTAKVTIKTETIDNSLKSGKRKLEKQVHKVQLLDVATGTGTFLSEVIKHIYQENFQNQQGLWSNYVEEQLLPRLHGFEILMASYAMCHLKIHLLLEETGYIPKNPLKQHRLGVYLTNSLEEAYPEAQTLFATWLSAEANAASTIKKDMPVMVAFGNPPYNVSTQNKGKWIGDLIETYKTGLNEQNINPLSDDYIKFIRHAEHYVERTGYGIVAMITNNSFLDGVIHRQMRKHLLTTFDTIYIYDLHGSAKKKETSPDGSPDQNVFDIQQGVSISMFIKHKPDNKELAEVYHADLYGKRLSKFTALKQNDLYNTGFKKVHYADPYYFFVPKDFGGQKKYEKGFGLNVLFKRYNMGVASGNDEHFVGTQKQLEKRFTNPEIKKYAYRAFDNRWINYDTKLLQRARFDLFRHVLNENLCFAFTRMRQKDAPNTFISKFITCRHLFSGETYAAPLYLYPTDTTQLSLDGKPAREPNLDSTIVRQIAKKLKIPFIADHEDAKADGKTAFSPLDLLDYIYAVLHSPHYRETYKSFLKIDFPRIPYPENTVDFWQLVALGRELRLLHLMESPVLRKLTTGYPENGTNKIEKISYKQGKVSINATQYFDNVPEVAWNFYIGGYQPAQKWLKDRKDQVLDFEDILHYQKMILALQETDAIMQKIDAFICGS